MTVWYGDLFGLFMVSCFNPLKEALLEFGSNSALSLLIHSSVCTLPDFDISSLVGICKNAWFQPCQLVDWNQLEKAHVSCYSTSWPTYVQLVYWSQIMMIARDVMSWANPLTVAFSGHTHQSHSLSTQQESCEPCDCFDITCLLSKHCNRNLQTLSQWTQRLKCHQRINTT